jgi:hypothetical protein
LEAFGVPVPPDAELAEGFPLSLPGDWILYTTTAIASSNSNTAKRNVRDDFGFGFGFGFSGIEGEFIFVWLRCY